MEDEDSLGIVGTTIGDKYVIDQVVGQGAFAIVYRATHLIWQRPVAIKCFRGLSHLGPEAERKHRLDFIEEGALLSELSGRSASIVQARDVGKLMTPEGEELPYIVLEWLDGRTLEAILSEEKSKGRVGFSLATAMRLLAPVASALELAHSRGVVHRDIKPGNILVCGDLGSQELRIKLLDFGIAKVVQGPRSMEFSKTAGTISSFTPGYAAPEQFTRSLGATGPWTDVYSLALVLVELLLGRPAMTGDDLIELGMAAVDFAHRPTPRALGIRVPEEVEIVLGRALEVRPGARFSTAGDFWLALCDAEQASRKPSLELVVDEYDLGPPRTENPGASPPVLVVPPTPDAPDQRSSADDAIRSGFITPAGRVALAVLAGLVAGITLFGAAPTMGKRLWSPVVVHYRPWLQRHHGSPPASSPSARSATNSEGSPTMTP